MEERDIIFLEQEFPKYHNQDINQKPVLSAYLVAEKIMRDLPEVQRLGCKCQYSGLQKRVNKLYEEWLSNTETD